MKKTTLFFLFVVVWLGLKAQVCLNGQLDNTDEMREIRTIQIPTKDGILLSTDIYLPILQDCVLVPVDINGQSYMIELIARGTQYVVYDTVTEISSFQLPVILSRTPYDKSSDKVMGSIFSIFGYAFIYQDMRGRYASEGMYFPMYSDGWEKYSYHPQLTLPMDPYPISDPSNTLHHTDGRDVLFYIRDSLKREYDINNDGLKESFLISNGKIGMFGASALGNSQFQAAASIPFTQQNPLSCLMPLVATGEHFNTTLFNNGVFRYSLVDGWLRGQLSVLDESMNDLDTSYSNTIHTPKDYGYQNFQELTDSLLSFMLEKKNGFMFSGSYPTSFLAKDLDISKAPINNNGESDSSGTISRYYNMNVPVYHLTGWWDIFIDGQIETFNRIRATYPHLKHVLVIGPWAHQTITTRKTGDITYPENVTYLLKVSFDEFEQGQLPLDRIYSSELLGWFRTHLGGEPYFFIPASTRWQDLGGILIRIPSRNYYTPYYRFLNFLGGKEALPNIPCELKLGSNIIETYVPINQLENPIFQFDHSIVPFNPTRFDSLPPVRLYITGPDNDPYNQKVGNYWVGVDSFPLKQGVSFMYLYLHGNRYISTLPPFAEEGVLSYNSNPHDPVITVGGNNMIPEVPGGGKKSQGSINLANPQYAPYTMNRNDVLAFETSPLLDTLVVVGFPEAAVYVKGYHGVSSYINFDVMMRIIDVYPDGREMFVTEGTVNVRARDYAQAIVDHGDPDQAVFSNALQDTYYYLKFRLLPMGHIFGRNHKIKILLSSSNYPRYQSNPHIPLNSGEFFLWKPGDTSGYVFQGIRYHALPAQITYRFSPDYPSYIRLPIVNNFTTILSQRNDQSLRRVQVYPNPVKDKLFVIAEQSEVELQSIDGKLIYRSFSEDKVELSLAGLSKGVYVLKIKKLPTSAIEVFKIIKN
ncbi:MAG: T9SS type A sorting domain-containing protein [Bacteroidales bacterium]|nr:T9SS type A sorting domain-containing protein [Bacteroidales bacterium]